jgi:hypothetical protein
VAAPSGADLESEALYKAEADKNMDEEEELFNLEELIVNPTTYTWEDKYRPRKPRYFNRVHTGYEWNKYNQTHYEYVFCHVSFVFLKENLSDTFHSTDNPPPKVVQGYKVRLSFPCRLPCSKSLMWIRCPVQYLLSRSYRQICRAHV